MRFHRFLSIGIGATMVAVGLAALPAAAVVPSSGVSTSAAVVEFPDIVKTRRDALVADLVAAGRASSATALSNASTACSLVSATAELATAQSVGGDAGRVIADALSLDAALLLHSPTSNCGGLKSAAPTSVTMTPTVDTSSAFTFTLSTPAPMFALDRTALAGPSTAYTGLTGTPVRATVENAGRSGSVGAPQIPLLTTTIAVPVGSKPSATVTEVEKVTLPKTLLAASQSDAADGLYDDPATVVNRDAYGRSVAVTDPSVTLTPLGKSRGVQLYQVSVPAVRYNPATRDTVVPGKMTVSVRFNSTSTSFSSVANAGSSFDRGTTALASTIANTQAFAGWLAGLKFPTERPCGAEVLIVTPTALKADADRLATAKRDAGFITKVYEMPAATTAAQLKAYIADLANSTCRIKLSYVILLGDTNYIPAGSFSSMWVATGYSSTATTPKTLATDATYAQVDADLVTDLFIGRLPAATAAEATTMVDKTIAYMKTPTIDSNFYNNSTVSGYFQIPVDDKGAATSLTQDARGFSRTANRIVDSMSSRWTMGRILVAASKADPKTYDDGSSIPSSLRKPTNGWNGTTSSLTSALNAGRFFLLHRDHGDVTAVGNPSLSTSDVAGLTNAGKQGLVALVDCLAGKFDSTSVAESFLRNSKGGAVGVIAASEVSPTWVNNDFALGIVDAFHTSLDSSSNFTGRRFGEILQAAKLYQSAKAGSGSGTEPSTTEWYLYNLMGDPTLPLYTSTPIRPVVITSINGGTVSVSASGSSFPTDTTVTALDSSGSPVARSTANGSVVLTKGTYKLIVDGVGVTATSVSVTIP